MSTVPLKNKRSKAAAPAPAPVDDKERFMAPLRGQIEPVQVSVVYQLGLALVAVMMLILPLVYIAIVGVVAYGVYYHAVYNAAVIFSMDSGTSSRRGGAAKAQFLIYIAPLIIGIVLLLFMIKPLFARRSAQFRPLKLRREQEPVLFEFVDRLCRLVGATSPSEIHIDSQVNASASFTNGFWSLFSNRLTLTIGLPLVAGLNVRQFGGVLAHEFGHFAQGTGMRLTYVIRSLNMWFARVVFERDAWDESLVRWSHEGGYWPIMLVLYLSRFFVWLTRRVLFVLMWIGHVVSSFMLRQMEFDADRYQTRVAGSDGFEPIMRQVAMLSVASNIAMNDLGAAWQEKRLGDDLSNLILAREIDMPADVRTAITSHLATSKTGWFDTHPADADRVASAQREKAAALLTVDEPATVLFADFAALSRHSTAMFYREALGAQFRPDRLVASQTLVKERNQQRETHSALARYFQGMINPVMPAFLPMDLTLPKSRDDAAELILLSRCNLTEDAERAAAAAKQWAEADERLTQAARVKALRDAGVGRIDPKSFGMTRGTNDEVSAIRAAALQQQASARAVLEPLLGDAMLRMAVALSLTEIGRPAAEPPSPSEGAPVGDYGEYDLAANVAAGSEDRVRDALRALRSTQETVEQLRQHFYALGTLLRSCRPEGNPDDLIQAVLSRARKTGQCLNDLRATLRSTEYPYEHGEKQVSIGRFMVESLPPGNEPVMMYHATQAALDAVYGLYVRLMADLAHRAEQAEQELGLPPLPEPKTDAPAEPAPPAG